jgi:superoxide dismutase, Cu-Zn family
LLVTLAALAALPVAGQERSAVATLVDSTGARMGEAHLTETPSEGVHIEMHVEGLPPGVYAFHIHETGACSPDFEAAGDHYAPQGNAHGPMHERGRHAGDLLNLHVTAPGKAASEWLADQVTLEPGAPGTLLDADGSALVIHAGADDYQSQPSGDAGSRLACGVIEG